MLIFELGSFCSHGTNELAKGKISVSKTSMKKFFNDWLVCCLHLDVVTIPLLFFIP